MMPKKRHQDTFIYIYVHAILQWHKQGSAAAVPCRCAPSRLFARRAVRVRSRSVLACAALFFFLASGASSPLAGAAALSRRRLIRQASRAQSEKKNKARTHCAPSRLRPRPSLRAPSRSVLTSRRVRCVPLRAVASASPSVPPCAQSLGAHVSARLQRCPARALSGAYIYIYKGVLSLFFGIIRKFRCQDFCRVGGIRYLCRAIG